MKFNERLICTINGEPHISTAGILLMCAEALHGPMPVSADARSRAQRTVTELLSAARAGGFTNADILETMIVKDRESDRVVDFALEAMACVGGAEQLAAALERAGFDPEGS
jgi:hypothetical protein